MQVAPALLDGRGVRTSGDLTGRLRRHASPEETSQIARILGGRDHAVGDNKIFHAIIVEIDERTRPRPAPQVDARLHGHIAETPVTCILKQGVSPPVPDAVAGIAAHSSASGSGDPFHDTTEGYGHPGRSVRRIRVILGQKVLLRNGGVDGKNGLNRTDIDPN